MKKKHLVLEEVIKMTFKELLNFACLIMIMYFLFCVLQYAPQIENLIIEMKGGAI